MDLNKLKLEIIGTTFCNCLEAQNVHLAALSRKTLTRLIGQYPKEIVQNVYVLIGENYNELIDNHVNTLQ